MRPNSYYRSMNREKAEVVRSLYFDKRYTQKQIAGMTGMAQSSVSRIISGVVWA